MPDEESFEMRETASGVEFSYLEWIAFVSIAFLVLSPALLVEIPAIADYPNNLARMYILAQNRNLPTNQYYEVVHSFVPNLAMDILVPYLARASDVPVATKFLFVLSEVLIVSGAVAIEMSVKGRHEISGYVALAVIYTVPFAVGLMNFELALGLALWAIALWIMIRESHWLLRLVVHCGFVFLLAVGHFLALGLYGAALVLYELRLLRASNGIASRMRTAIILALPAMIVISILVAVGESAGAQNEWLLAAKVLSVCCSLNGYSFRLSAIGIATFVALIYLFVRIRGEAKLAPAGQWIGIGLLTLFLLLPTRLFGSFYADGRIFTGALLILPAFFLITSRRASRVWIPASISVVALMNTVVVAGVWLSYRDDYKRIMSSFALLEPASRVLVASTGGEVAGLAGDPFRHAPTLAVHFAGALVPSLFAIPGAQPIRLRSRYRDFQFGDSGEYDPTALAVLQSAARGEATRAPEFIGHWTERFEYLYLLGRRPTNPMPHLLGEILAGEHFALYRIRR